jgi:dihydroorotate dehydrogenase
MLYEFAAAPLLFALDAETAHDLTLASLRTAPALLCRSLRRARRPAGTGAWASTSPTASAWPPDSTRTANASTGWPGWASASSKSARSRPAAAGQPQAAHVPPAAGAGHHQPHGLQQPRRRCADRKRAIALRSRRRHSRHQHRQELRHADRARRRRLPACLRKVYTRWPATSRSTSPRPTPRTCASCRADPNWTPCSAAHARAGRLDAASGRRVPLALKIAPDLDEAQIDVIADALIRHRIDALIVTNTTLAQGGRAPRRTPTRPAACPARRCSTSSTAVLRALSQRLGGEVPN